MVAARPKEDRREEEKTPPKEIHHRHQIKASVGVPEAEVEPGQRRREQWHSFSHQWPCGGTPRIGGLLRFVELHR
jgi:hypothetical protein